MHEISIDYEVRGDAKGNWHKDLIENTDIILTALSKINLKVRFYLEVEEIIYFKRYVPRLFQAVLEQLRCIKEEGHYFGMHIHPQWDDASPMMGDVFSPQLGREWRLHKYKEGAELVRYLQRRRLFYQNLLDEIDADSTEYYFRAGGYNLGKTSNLELILKAGFTNDSSILMKCIANSSSYQYDYRTIEGSFSYDCGVNGEIRELVVASANLHLIETLQFKRLVSLFLNGRSSSSADKENKSHNASTSFLSQLRSQYRPLDFVLLPSKCFKKGYSQVANINELSIIGHNKSLFSRRHLYDNLSFLKDTGIGINDV